MTQPRNLRIMTGLGVIAFLAVDFAWIRRILSGSDSLFGFRPQVIGEAGIFDLGIMAMSNVIGVSYLVSRGQRRPFLRGFEIGGILAMALYVGAWWVFPGWIGFDVVVMSVSRIGDYCWLHVLPAGQSNVLAGSDSIWPGFRVIFLLALFTVVLVFPFLVVAVLGGLISRRFARSTNTTPLSDRPATGA